MSSENCIQEPKMTCSRESLLTDLFGTMFASTVCGKGLTEWNSDVLKVLMGRH